MHFPEPTHACWTNSLTHGMGRGEGGREKENEKKKGWKEETDSKLACSSQHLSHQQTDSVVKRSVERYSSEWLLYKRMMRCSITCTQIQYVINGPSVPPTQKHHLWLQREHTNTHSISAWKPTDICLLSFRHQHNVWEVWYRTEHLKIHFWVTLDQLYQNLPTFLSIETSNGAKPGLGGL